jgi:hypothetical protein
MYLIKHRIDRNWRHVELTSPHRLRTLKGHDDHVVRGRGWVIVWRGEGLGHDDHVVRGRGWVIMW